MRVLFVSSRNSNFKINPLVKTQGDSLSSLGVKIEYFTISGSGIFTYLKNIRNLRKHLKQNNYDLIHAHYSFCGLVVLLTFSRYPLVVSFMGSDALGYVNPSGKKKFRSYLNIFLSKFIQLFVDKIIVKSKNLMNTIYLKKKAVLIPNGVNMKTFRPLKKYYCLKKLKLKTNKPKIVFLCNTNSIGKNYHLLEKSTNFFNITNYEIHHPYPISHENIVYWLNASDVLVMTSFYEGSPNIIKEAMACNCPIVSTDVGDVREIIGNTEGCYITSFNPENVADQIMKALEYSKKHGKTNGRIRLIHLGLDLETIAKRIVSVYQDILNKNDKKDRRNYH
jgi:teichuronic acid biosynthesis glycosyltransferase TuaC